MTKALQVLSLLQGYEMYAWRIVDRIESLKIASHSKFQLGQTLACERQYELLWISGEHNTLGYLNS